jgi:hypothetical protein
MASVTRRLGAFIDESIVLSATYDDVTGTITQFSATFANAQASCLIAVRNETNMTAVGSAILRQGTLTLAAPASTAFALDKPLGCLSGARALIIQVPGA